MFLKYRPKHSDREIDIVSISDWAEVPGDDDELIYDETAVDIAYYDNHPEDNDLAETATLTRAAALGYAIEDMTATMKHKKKLPQRCKTA